MAHFDVTKARTFLHYCSKATQKLKERELARKKIAVALKRLKGISTETIQKDIDVLEKQISQALQAEKKILTKQDREATIHGDLQDKIDLLQKKLGRYIETKEARENKLKDLEEKILKLTHPEKYKILELKEELRELEQDYEEEKSAGNHKPSELREVEERIFSLKERIQELSMRKPED